MKRFILFSLLAFLFVSCNSLKRLEKLADKHGEEITDTISIDTTINTPGLNFDTSYSKEKDILELNGQIDTTNIKLYDGTEVTIINEYSVTKNERGDPVSLGIKSQNVIFREEKSHHFKKDKSYKRISVTPPDKVDAFLANFKWFALSILGIFGIVLLVRKMFI